MTSKETAKHRHAFESFYVSNRDFAKVSQNLPINVWTLRNWAEKYDWHMRADMRDHEAARLAEQQAIAAKAQELAEANKAIKDMRARHAQIATVMQGKIVQRLQSLEVDKLTPRDLAYWFDVTVKIERLSRGEPTEITDVLLDERLALHKKLEQMTDAELDTFIAEQERLERERHSNSPSSVSTS
jgi:hypothetical protein